MPFQVFIKSFDEVCDSGVGGSDYFFLGKVITRQQSLLQHKFIF